MAAAATAEFSVEMALPRAELFPELVLVLVLVVDEVAGKADDDDEERGLSGGCVRNEAAFALGDEA